MKKVPVMKSLLKKLMPKKQIQKVRSVFRVVSFSFGVSFATSKKYTVLRILIEVFMALIPFAVIYIGRQTINSLVMSDGGNGPAGFDQRVLNFMMLLGALLILETANTLIQKVKEYYGGIHKDLIGREINEQIAGKAGSLDLSYFDSTTFYNGIMNAQRDSHAVETLTWFVIDMIRSFIQFAVSIIVLAGFNPIVTLLIISAGIPSMVIEKSFTQKVYNWQWNRAPEERKMGYIIGILLGRNYAKEIRLFDIKEVLMAKYRDIWKKWFGEKRNILARQFKWTSLLSVLPRIATTGFLIYVGVDIIYGRLTIGDYTLYSGMVGQLMAGLFMLIHLVSQLYDNNMRISNYDKFLHWDNRIGVEGIGTKTPVLPMEIEFRNVSFRYPGTEAYILRDVSFRIGRNEKIALVGNNGAGKSTIVKLILGFYEPTEGSILINGIDSKEYDTGKLQRCFAVMFQDYVNYAFTIKENIVLSDIANKNAESDISDACTKSGLESVIGKFDTGLDTYLTRQFEENGEELSGGEWQKVALARTFFRDAAVIILDEPSSSLDAEAEHRLFLQMAALCEGKGAVFISHRLSNVTMADRIIVLDNGSVIEDGSHYELLRNNGKYAYLFNLQAEKYKSV